MSELEAIAAERDRLRWYERVVAERDRYRKALQDIADERPDGNLADFQTGARRDPRPPARQRKRDEMSHDGYSIRVTVNCGPETTRKRAEQIARQIQKYAEARPGVENCYEREVYSGEDLDAPADVR